MMTQEEYYQPKSNPLAIIGLIVGIISVLMVIMSCCFLPLVSSGIGSVFGITAFILGLVARKQIKEQGGSASQSKMATAAFILGIIGGVLGIISLAISIIVKLVFSGPAIDQLFQEALDSIQNP
jgi:hypothetical protein